MAATCLVAAAVCSFVSAAQSYVLTDCEPYVDDIKSAMLDAVEASRIAWLSIDPAFGARVTVADWFGLMNPMFHGIMDDEGRPWNDSLIDIFQYASDFPTQEYATLTEAREAELDNFDVELDLPADLDNFDVGDLPAVEDTLEYSCNPRRFRKVDGDEWQDRTTGEIYIIQSADQICPGDGSVKLRLALHLAEPQHFIAILCPSILGQSDGQPKMYATLEGVELSNTRPNGDPPLDVLSYVGMSIDDLRARVLSVYLGRVILMMVAAKWPSIAGIKPRPGFKTFNGAKTLPLASALTNVDSLSIYMTGARFFYLEMIGIDEEFDNGQTLRFTSQLSHRWNSNGTLYYNELPRVCVTAPELDTSECVATMRNIPGLEAADLSPYYTLGDDGDDGKTWYAVGRWY